MSLEKKEGWETETLRVRRCEILLLANLWAQIPQAWVVERKSNISGHLRSCCLGSEWARGCRTRRNAQSLREEEKVSGIFDTISQSQRKHIGTCQRGQRDPEATPCGAKSSWFPAHWWSSPNSESRYHGMNAAVASEDSLIRNEILHLPLAIVTAQTCHL